MHVAHGRTRYLTDDRAGVDREFANIFVCRFDAEGRCREFTEYYMRRRPEASRTSTPAASSASVYALPSDHHHPSEVHSR